MKITLELSADESIALRRLANEYEIRPELAARVALRDWLVGAGYLDLPIELDEDTETVGEA